MHSGIADKKEELAELCRRHGVARLEGFGSAARGTDFEPLTSDADFPVEFRPDSGWASLRQYFEFAEASRRALGRPVDLVEPDAVWNPYLRAAIDKPRELVFES